MAEVREGCDLTVNGGPACGTPGAQFMAACVHEHVMKMEMCVEHQMRNGLDKWVCTRCEEIDGHSCPVSISPA